MNPSSYQIFDGKIILRVRDHLCDSPEELITSQLFRELLNITIGDLSHRGSRLMNIFENRPVTQADIQVLVDTLFYLIKLPSDLVTRVVPEAEQFFRDRGLFNDFIEYLYNYWRTLQRLIVCDSVGDRFDKRPYRTFNRTVETLTHIVRSTYRDLQENITGNHPRIYRQVRAGAEIATIALPKNINYPEKVYDPLNQIPVIRQVLIYPPLIFTPPMNKRTGSFERVSQNPLNGLTIHPHQWLCYPARVGPLLIMIYFSIRFFELGFSLCNLFELADEESLKRTPDAVYLYGVPSEDFQSSGSTETIFYDDEQTGMLVGAVPEKDQYAYFGYLKKMVLTLHNIQMMKRGRLPFHGALVHLTVRDHKPATILLMGDTGAGKSETLEAFRLIAGDEIQDITIIADDMGSLNRDAQHTVQGYGTETGAFVRLDDLQPGYAFGQIDRTIIMSPNQTNARVVLPVTTFENVVKGFPVDFILYANNYETVDESHPTIERFDSAQEALAVFREGAVMSKGTTSTTGRVSTYFANIFGPEQYQELHEELAKIYFQTFFDQSLYVGQMRTQLGIAGMERKGPELAARALLKAIQEC